MTDPSPPGRAGLTPSTLDALLEGVVRNHKAKVIGWLRDEPGCWGFLAGQAVTECRRQLGRPLAEAERRMVWDRLWWWLEQIKAGVTR
ncbi:MAG: hypothetical protein FJ316_03490 [SAR202 cluster bacterium]|nr:hypothetical protein [SAR202 cluster bacterium]